jgi:hypothetical protein
MARTQSIRAKRVRFLLACAVALAMALAACSTNAPASASAVGQTETESSASQASGTSHAPSASPVIPPPGTVNEPRTIHLILRPSNDTQVSVGSLSGCTNTTSCQGDYRIGDDPLFDATTGEEVGTLVYVEFVVKTGDSLFHSPGNTITLTGRGQIVFSETLYDDGSGRPATGAILAGTGEFLGATGSITSKSLPGSGDFVVTLTN